jgi:hypothetical protein
LQDLFDKRQAMGGAIINLQLTIGHAPKFTRAAGAMALTIRLETSTPRPADRASDLPNGADRGV